MNSASSNRSAFGCGFRITTAMSPHLTVNRDSLDGQGRSPTGYANPPKNDSETGFGRLPALKFAGIRNLWNNLPTNTLQFFQWSTRIASAPRSKDYNLSALAFRGMDRHAVPWNLLAAPAR